MKNNIWILICLFLLNKGVSQNEIRVKVNSSNNDGTEFYSVSNLFSPSLEHLTLGERSGGTLVGVNFESINIPKEATIDSAFIQFSAKEISRYDNEVFVNIELKGNSETFPTGGANVLSPRNKSEIWLKWHINGLWSTNDRTQFQRTPDLKDLISEVMQLPEWESGNPLTFFIESEGQASIELRAYDAGLEEHYPELIIHYSITSNTETTKDLGASIKVRPNPFNSEVYIDLKTTQLKTVDVNLFNLMGEKVFEANLKSSYSFNFDHLPSGIYFLKIKSGNQILKTEKLIKN